jgi:hypothetical protein
MDKKSSDESYLEGKLSGMFYAHEAFNVVMEKLLNSIDNVWMIHDQEDIVTTSVKEYKDKLMFAHSAISVLREMFGDEFDSRINEIKAAKEDY